MSCGDQRVSQRGGSHIGVGELLEWQPEELQVVFLAEWLGGVDPGFEDEVIPWWATPCST